MGTKRKTIEDELSRFEAEIAKPNSSHNLFVPHSVRPIIAANTFNTVQQKLQQQPEMRPKISIPPPPIPPPSFMPTFVPTQLGSNAQSILNTSKPISSTQVVLSSAPKLYQSRQTVNVPSVAPTPQIDINAIQFDVTQKLKKLKAEKTGPNPIAEEAIKAAKASSALQSFQATERKKKR